MKYKKSISYIHKVFDTGDISKKIIEKYVDKNSQFGPTDKKK